VDLDAAAGEEETAREQLLSLQTEIEKAEQKVLLIPQYESPLITTQKQLAALQKPEVKELIDLQRQLSTERELRLQIQNKVQEAKRDLGRVSPKAFIDEIPGMVEPADLSVGAAEFSAIVKGINAFEKIATSRS
jgi:hypothetical protein